MALPATTASARLATVSSRFGIGDLNSNPRPEVFSGGQAWQAAERQIQNRSTNKKAC